MTTRQLDTATRLVWLARWLTGPHGDEDGCYTVTLSCGHTIRCSLNFLRASILCTKCLETDPRA
jgi:hypothetical protein